MAKQASSGPTKSEFSTSKEVRVIHIGNPRLIKASPSEFRAVVQSLTGLKKRQSSTSEMESDCEESSQSKVPKHEGEFQFCSILGIPETAALPQMAQESNNIYGSVDQEEICDIYTNHMMGTLDGIDGKFFPDIISFDFMTSTSDVV
ncbi:hypothetical protein SUGI_1109780 [Cryptomeria japonica]|nr:hypothetical protein SUGI_1109780 [Cryptomeria japonica]